MQIEVQCFGTVNASVSMDESLRHPDFDELFCGRKKSGPVFSSGGGYPCLSLQTSSTRQHRLKRATQMITPSISTPTHLAEPSASIWGKKVSRKTSGAIRRRHGGGGVGGTDDGGGVDDGGGSNDRGGEGVSSVGSDEIGSQPGIRIFDWQMTSDHWTPGAVVAADVASWACATLYSSQRVPRGPSWERFVTL